MAKTITFTNGKKKYILEYTRATAEEMESNGFRIQQSDDMPVTMTNRLYVGAFRANHPELTDEEIFEIIGNLKNKKDLIRKLIEMYADTVNTLYDDEGNVEWGANW